MTALDFPANPAVGDTFTSGGKTWRWDGTKWVLQSSGTTPTPWLDLTLTNGWTNSGGAFQTAQYRKIGDIVYLRGHIVPGTLGQTAFTLPEGFQAPASVDCAIAYGPSTPGEGHMWIQPNGNCNIYAPDGIVVAAFSIQFSVTP